MGWDFLSHNFFSIRARSLIEELADSQGQLVIVIEDLVLSLLAY
jgi:hypothetical protein